MYMTLGLHKSLQMQPDAVAIHSVGRTVTFREYGDRVARLAGALRKLGVESGERVAMYSLNSTRYLEYFMAVPWAGGVLNPVNIRWSQAEVLYSLDDSGTEVMIVDDTFKATAAALAGAAKTVRHLIYAGDGETPEGMLNYETLIEQAEPVEDAWRHDNDLAGIFYTGGTTGFPKGVMLSHANLISAAMAVRIAGYFGGPEAVYLHAMPMFHLADFSIVIALTISGGKHVVIPAFTPQATLEAIESERVTDILLAPTMLQMTMEWLARNPGSAARLDLSSLKKLAYGASPISQALVLRTQEVFPGVGLINGYGMTELAPAATYLAPQYHSEEGFASGRMRSVGKPYESVEVKVVDDSDREVPRGTVGEVIVRGQNVMLGYWNRPEETAKALRDGWMHTGDGGYMDKDGFLYIVDRIKDMIITGGENVYSAEVENALASHPAVAQCAVIGIPDERWGETVHAVIVRKPGADVTPQELETHCRALIAGYKVPRSVAFRESLPLTSVGKVNKNELRKPYRDGNPHAGA